MDEKVEYLESKKVPVKHGFFTRSGGVSEDRHFGLNVSLRTKDEPAKVYENRKRAAEALGFSYNNFLMLSGLAHDNNVAVVDKSNLGDEIVDCDAIVTSDRDILIGLSIADCLPIVLYSDKAVGVVHGGWRGLVAGVIEETVGVFISDFEVNANEIVAVVGPGISQESYEFGEEAEKIFDAQYLKRMGKDNLLHVDIKSMARDKLRELGIQEIDEIDVDTFKDERFFSARRDGFYTGRFLAAASLQSK